MYGKTQTGITAALAVSGGCGVNCAAFLDGECNEPQEISKQDLIDEHGEEDAKTIFAMYECFSATGV